MTIEDKQKSFCKKYGADYRECSQDMKIGVADNIALGGSPINGLRHKSTDDMSGWFIWAGESMSDAEDFFKPSHVGHVLDIIPELTELLGLAPGWRFLIDIKENYIDVWFDETLLRS